MPEVVYEKEIRKEGNDCYQTRKVIVTKESLGGSVVYIITGLWQYHGSWVDDTMRIESSVHQERQEEVIKKARYWLEQC